MHLPKGISTAYKPNVPLLGYQGGTVTEDPGLHTSLTVLAGEVQPTDTRPTMPFGEVHARTKEVMESYVAFSGKASLEGATPWGSMEVQTQATIPTKTQSAPPRSPLNWQLPARIPLKC